MPKGVEGTGFDQGFGDTFAAGHGVNGFQIVGEVFEFPDFSTAVHNRGHNIFTNIADCAESEANIFAHGLVRVGGFIYVR